MEILSLEFNKKLTNMKKAGEILTSILNGLRDEVKPGIRTEMLDAKAQDLFKKFDVEPAFLGYKGFPKSICTSVNEEVVHGIPGNRVLSNGDILSIDIGLKHNGYYSDMAITIPVGSVSKKALDIIEAGRATLQRAVDVLVPGMPLRDLSRSIQEYAEGRGYDVLRKYVGHEIGQKMHEDIQIPNFVTDIYPPADVFLEAGMAIAIEPMLTEGTFEVECLNDGWTVVTCDRKLSVHFEYTVMILEDSVEVLTFF